MKRLLILRHGEASWKASSDEQRELTDFGRIQANRIGRYLAAMNISPLVLVSPYLRAQQTAQELVKHNPTWQLNTNALITPSGNVEDICDLLYKQKGDDVLLVSHQPLVSDLVTYLIEGSKGRPVVSFSTACLALLKTEGVAGLAELIDYASPESLDEYYE